MKVLDRIFVVLFNFCLLFATAVISVFAIASSPAYYHKQFEKTGIYSTTKEDGTVVASVIPYINGDKTKRAVFTDEQLDEIINHIVSYLFSDQESFELVMDNVKLNGVMTDDVSIFGEIAVEHMEDVKVLLIILGVLAIVAGVSAVAMLTYFIKRSAKGGCGILLKGTLAFYGVFVWLIVAFCAWTLFDLLLQGLPFEDYLRLIWRNFHYIIFPSPEKFAGSFFNDTLTVILTLDLFMAAVVQVLFTILIAVMVWIIVAGLLDRKARE